jgi:hypothetical protein
LGTSDEHWRIAADQNTLDQDGKKWGPPVVAVFKEVKKGELLGQVRH